MKSLTIVLVLILILCSEEPASAQTVQLKLGDYSLTVASAPKKDNGLIPFIQGSFAKAAKGTKPFGFSYAENDKAMSDVVIEIADAATKSLLKNITAADLAGKAKTETQSGGARTTSTYQFGSGASMVELQVELEVVADEGMPLGKKIHVTYKIRIPKASAVNAVLKLKTDGSAQKLGNSGIVSSRMEKDQPAYPAVLLSSLMPVKIDVLPRTNGIQQAAFQAENIATKQKDWATIFSFDVNGTTVKDAAKTTVQAAHIASRIETKEARPDLVIFNTASATTSAPGDTVTYTITYCNIGSALAQDAEITNPVPDGVKLIERSVENKDADVVIERKPAMAPETGEPSLVRWKMKKQIMPGEEGKITMKVIVR